MPFKTWVSGELVTATDQNNHLQQQIVATFADAAARDAAIIAPTEGQYAELADTGLTVRRSAAWHRVLTRHYTTVLSLDADNSITATPQTVTFPSGLFAAAPVVLCQSYGTSVWHAYPTGTASTVNVNVSARHLDAQATTATIPVYVLAVEVT